MNTAEAVLTGGGGCNKPGAEKLTQWNKGALCVGNSPQ
jgi:hypothetical protein